MRVLVTGASGLIGKQVVAKLATEKSVSLIVPAHEKPNQSCDRFVFIPKFRLDCDESGSALSDVSPDIIVHCAAKIPTVTVSAEAAAAENARIDKAIYNVARSCGAQIIFMSSVSVYEQNIAPWDESNVVAPLNPYARQKHASEVLFSSFGIAAASLRVSSPYGGWQSAQRNVLYKFIYAAMMGQDLEIYGDGLRQQDFVYAPDIADAVWSIILARLAGTKIKGIFNIASGKPVSMSDLAELIVNVVGRGTVVKSDAVCVEAGLPPSLNIGKANAILNWCPSTALASGIEKTIASLGNQDADRFCF